MKRLFPAVLLFWALSARAERVVTEGKPSTGAAITVSSLTVQVDVGTSTPYGGAVPNVALFTTSNVVVGTSGCVLYSTGSAACPTFAASAVTISNTLVIATNTAVTIPYGSTAQRPGSPTGGETRLNTDTGNLEIYDAAAGYWEKFAPASSCSAQEAPSPSLAGAAFIPSTRPGRSRLRPAREPSRLSSSPAAAAEAAVLRGPAAARADFFTSAPIRSGLAVLRRSRSVPEASVDTTARDRTEAIPFFGSATAVGGGSGGYGNPGNGSSGGSGGGGMINGSGGAGTSGQGYHAGTTLTPARSIKPEEEAPEGPEAMPPTAEVRIAAPAASDSPIQSPARRHTTPAAAAAPDRACLLRRRKRRRRHGFGFRKRRNAEYGRRREREHKRSDERLGRLRGRHRQLPGAIDMKKILLALTLIAGAPALAGEWALVDSSGTVKNVIVADAVTVLNRDDGPWIKTYKKVGKGWRYDGAHFSAPGSTSTVVVSTKTR